MSSNKYYYYLKNELNSIKFIQCYHFIMYLLLFFFLQKNIFRHTFESLVESGFLGDRQQSGVGSDFTQQIVSIRVRHLVIQNIMVDPW